MQSDAPAGRDRPFSLVEAVVVVVVLVVLSAVMVLGLRGVGDPVARTACESERQMLESAAVSYMARVPFAELPALGTSGDRHELFLIDAGLLAQVSPAWNLDAAGAVVPAGQPCRESSTSRRSRVDQLTPQRDGLQR
jgi:hypothetical protein